MATHPLENSTATTEAVLPSTPSHVVWSSSLAGVICFGFVFAVVCFCKIRRQKKRQMRQQNGDKIIQYNKYSRSLLPSPTNQNSDVQLPRPSQPVPVPRGNIPLKLSTSSSTGSEDYIIPENQNRVDTKTYVNDDGQYLALCDENEQPHYLNFPTESKKMYANVENPSSPSNEDYDYATFAVSSAFGMKALVPSPQPPPPPCGATALSADETNVYVNVKDEHDSDQEKFHTYGNTYLAMDRRKFTASSIYKMRRSIMKKVTKNRQSKDPEPPYLDMSRKK